MRGVTGWNIFKFKKDFLTDIYIQALFLCMSLPFLNKIPVRINLAVLKFISYEPVSYNILKLVIL